MKDHSMKPDVAELQLALLRRAVGVMFQGWMIQRQTETECDGMDVPGRPCDPVEQCKCKNEITRYIEIAKGRERHVKG